jgi:hypothetical protein
MQFLKFRLEMMSNREVIRIAFESAIELKKF